MNKEKQKELLSLANKTRNSMSLANKKAKYFRKDTNYDFSQNNK
jgi:hypothetical protein